MNAAAVIFDMDGLMLDTERVVLQACKIAAAELGHELTDEMYISTLGRNETDTERILCECLGSTFSYASLIERLRFHLDSHGQRDQVDVKPGLLALLDLLEARSVPKAVATSTPRERANRRLDQADIRPRFHAIVTGDEIRNGKPAPDIFLKAAERLAVEPANCIVLEDSRAGIRAAHAAGMMPIMIPDLEQPCEEIARLAHRVFPSLHEARNYFEEILKLDESCISDPKSESSNWTP